MASTNSWTLEIASPVAAPRLFRAAVLDWHTLAPKLVSLAVASAHPVEGEGGVRQFNFTSAMPFSFMKEKLEFLDVDKFECKSTLVEGGGIGVAIETATSHIKVEPAAGGGSVVKVESTYKPLPGGVMKDDYVASKAKESVTAILEGNGMPYGFFERLEVLDADNCDLKSTILEGGVAIESATTLHVKVESAAGGGSVVMVESNVSRLTTQANGPRKSTRPRKSNVRLSGPEWE